MDRRVKERLVGATILVVLIVLIVPELLSGPKTRVAPPPSAAGQAEPMRNVTVDLATSKATPAENTAASAAPSATEGAATPTGAGTVPGEQPPGQAPSGNAPPAGNPSPGNAPPREAAAPGESGAAASGPGDATGGLPPVTNRVIRPPAPPTIATLKAQQPVHSSGSELESEPSPPRSTARASAKGNANETAPAGASNHRWAVQLGSFASRANAEKLVHQLKPREVSVYVSSSGRGAALRYRVRIGPLADRDAAERLMAKLKKEGQASSLVPP